MAFSVCMYVSMCKGDLCLCLTLCVYVSVRVYVSMCMYEHTCEIDPPVCIRVS